jgi:hypothetical protein
VVTASEFDALTTEWLTLAELAAAIGVPVSTLRQWVREGGLVTVPRGDRAIQSVPAAFVSNGALVRGLASAFTVLADVGFTPTDALIWLLTADDWLGARPVDLMAEGRDVAVRRRAMMLAL